jgi:hypothetical protein
MMKEEKLFKLSICFRIDSLIDVNAKSWEAVSLRGMIKKTNLVFAAISSSSTLISFLKA